MNFGFLLFTGVEELDLVGPWEMVSVWSEYAQGPENRFLIAEGNAPITCAKGMVIQPNTTFAEAPQLDFLLVPGGEGTLTEVNNPALIDFVKQQAQGCKAVLSVCTGAFILHHAGLLQGRKATTHWMHLDRLRESGDVEVMEERIVRDENVWTSAGVSAGIDLALALIADVAGDKAAGMVQFGAEYYPSSKSYGDFHQHPKAPGYLKTTT